MKNKIQNNIHCHTTHLPLVSIGIPTFNRPELLRQALESARSQTYPNLEILVSDNESTDAQTSKILAEASAIDFRIKTYRQKKNIGPTANFEFLLNIATGDFFTWLADDDLMHPTCIKLLVAAHKQNPRLVCAFSDVMMIDAKGNSLGTKKHVALRNSPYKSRAEKMRAIFFSGPQCQATYGLFRTAIARQCPFEKSTYKNMAAGCEFTFLARLASFGDIVAVPNTLRSYRLHSHGLYVTCIKHHSLLDRLIRSFEYGLRILNIAIRTEDSVRLKFLFTMHSIVRLVRPPLLILVCSKLLTFLPSSFSSVLKAILSRPHNQSDISF